MGAVTDTLFGGSESSSSQQSSSTPIDMTPGVYENLRQPIANQLSNVFASGGGPSAPGNYTANVTGNEQQLLDQIQTQATGGGSQASQAGQNFLQNLLAGSGNGNGGGQMSALTDIQGIQGGTPQGESNPFLQDAITSAQRQVTQQYQDEIAPAMRANFSQAGQQIQGQGSSPFQMAAAREQSGMANALSDIATDMSFQDFSQRQQLGSQEFQQLRDLMVNQNLTGRGQELEQEQLGLQEQQQQLEGTQLASQIDRGQLDNMLSSLEAQALPRMVEQLGIDQGVEEFRRRQGQLMEALQLAGRLGGPIVAQESESTGSSQSESNPNIVGTILPW